jgi:uncharacterized membrane protein YebE (DUF533 family)
MHQDEFSLVRSLVPVAWADGSYESQEREMLEALLDAYGASDAQKEELRSYASAPKALADINLQDLSSGDRRLLLTLADGKQANEELAVLNELADKLRIPEAEAKSIVKSASDRAKQNLKTL